MASESGMNGGGPLTSAWELHPEVLSLFTALFLIGLKLAGLVTALGPWTWFFCALAAIGASLLLPGDRPWSWLPLGMTALAVGAFTFAARVAPPVPDDAWLEFDKIRGSLTGTCVGDFRQIRGEHLSVVLEACEFRFDDQTLGLPGRTRCQVASLALLPEPGQRYAASGTLRILANRRMPLFQADSLTPVGPANLLGPVIGDLQQRLRDGLGRLLPPRHQAFVLAFLLGDTSGLDFHDRRAMQQTGLTHVLAVSGQHLVILVGLLTAILCWARIPPLSRGLLSVGFLIGYGLLCGGQPSVWRAIAMYTAAVAILHLEADPGPVRPLALATFFLILYKPEWVSHIGFQLSFLAVLGILLGRIPLERALSRFRLPVVITRYLAVGLAANLATAPLVVYHFGYFPLVGLLANAALVWSFAVILPMGLLLALLGNIWFPVGIIMAVGLSLLLDVFLAAVHAFASLPGGQLWVGPFPGWVVALLYAAMLWFLTRLEEAPALVESPVVAGTRPGVPSPRPPVSAPATIRITDASPGARTPTVPAPPAPRPVLNPLGLPTVVEAIDQQMAVFPKRSLKSKGHHEVMQFPIARLGVESQTLFHRLDDLTGETLRGEPDRLLQAQVFAMALLGGEILAKVPALLTPPPRPGDITVSIKARNRHLAMVLAAEAFFQSALPGRATQAELTGIIARAQKLHLDGRALLDTLTRDRTPAQVDDHLRFRQTVLDWARDLVALTDRDGVQPKP